MMQKIYEIVGTHLQISAEITETAYIVQSNGYSRL